MTEPLFPQATDKRQLEEGEALTPRFGENGLITAIAVDADTNAVLMVAHMNAEALAKTLETGQAWYWSRSRGALWLKGETSGQIQRVEEMLVDCDQDAIVMRVRVAGDGGCCHTGRRSCFYRRVVPQADGGPLLVTIDQRPAQ